MIEEGHTYCLHSDAMAPNKHELRIEVVRWTLLLGAPMSEITLSFPLRMSDLPYLATDEVPERTHVLATSQNLTSKHDQKPQPSILRNPKNPHRSNAPQSPTHWV
jgi:hypothetical protein